MKTNEKNTSSKQFVNESAMSIFESLLCFVDKRKTSFFFSSYFF